MENKDWESLTWPPNWQNMLCKGEKETLNDTEYLFPEGSADTLRIANDFIPYNRGKFVFNDFLKLLYFR